jgi:hypothetical protein
VAGLFRPDEPDSDDEVSASTTLSDLNITGVFRAYYLASGESLPLSDFINSEYSAADRKECRTGIRGAEGNIKSEGQKNDRLRFYTLDQLIH